MTPPHRTGIMWGMTEPGCSDPQLAGYGKAADKVENTLYSPGSLKTLRGYFSAIWIPSSLGLVLRLALFFAAAMAL